METGLNAPGRVCGVDEAGRGPLAGPVIAAAVCFRDPSHIPEGLNDSKALSAARREALFEMIMARAEVGVGECSPAEIDRVNILQATLTAMARAVDALPRPMSHALVDGNWPPALGACQAHAIVKGDARCVSIAAASIIAKVTRDAIMIEADERFPGCGFARHKGYPSAAHREALIRLGPSPIHRRSFAPVARLIAA